jgi:hypothetical protein
MAEFEKDPLDDLPAETDEQGTEPSNRPFLIAAGLMLLAFLVALLLIGYYVLFLGPRQQAARLSALATDSVLATQTAQTLSLTQEFENFQATAIAQITPSPTSTPVPSFTPSATPSQTMAAAQQQETAVAATYEAIARGTVENEITATAFAIALGTVENEETSVAYANEQIAAQTATAAADQISAAQTATEESGSGIGGGDSTPVPGASATAGRPTATRIGGSVILTATQFIPIDKRTATKTATGGGNGTATKTAVSIANVTATKIGGGGTSTATRLPTLAIGGTPATATKVGVVVATATPKVGGVVATRTRISNATTVPLPTATALPQGGFADEAGLPVLLFAALGLLILLIVVRQIRTANSGS